MSLATSQQSTQKDIFIFQLLRSQRNCQKICFHPTAKRLLASHCLLVFGFQLHLLKVYFQKRAKRKQLADSSASNFIPSLSVHVILSRTNQQPRSGNLEILNRSGNVGCNATHIFLIWSRDTWHPVFPYQTIFYFHMSIVNHFRNKILSAHRNIHIMQILCRVPPKKGLFREDFLFVRRKRHAGVRSAFFHIKSWCRKIRYIEGIGGHVWPNKFCT